MRLRLPLLITGLAASVALGSPVVSGAEEPSLPSSATPAPSTGPAIAPDEVIVKYRDGVDAGEAAEIKEETGTGGAQTLPGEARELEIRDGETVAQTLAELRENPGVEYAKPNYVARASAFVPNDPGRGGFGDWRELQWNFAGPFGVNAPDAWELAAQAGAPGGRGAVVAVLDTGVAYETRGRFKRAPDLSKHRYRKGYDFVADDERPNDENGHGTHITGTIAQVTNNGKGLTGLAYGVDIMPVRVLDAQGEGATSDIARGIRYAARKGADVINLSFEFHVSVGASDVPAIASAIRYANNRGTLIVGAAGNQEEDAIAYPARSSRVVAVGATTEHGCKADYSNDGADLDITAPGGGFDTALAGNANDNQNCRPSAGGRDVIQQTFPSQRELRSFGLPGGYNGTSMAAPHVTGTAALVVATKRLGKKPAPALLLAHLQATARDLGAPGPDPRYGAGLVDAAAALR